jgi:hypothetical protein
LPTFFAKTKKVGGRAALKRTVEVRKPRRAAAGSQRTQRHESQHAQRQNFVAAPYLRSIQYSAPSASVSTIRLGSAATTTGGQVLSRPMCANSLFMP